MSEHDLETSCVNQRSVPRNADTLRLKESAQRSWRTVETARRHAAVAIIGVTGQGFADNAPRLDQDRRGKDAGKAGMQCAAGIGQITAVVAVRRDLPFVGVVVAMLMMVMRESRVRNRLGVGARRRHHARELRDQKQGDQQPDKPRYRPKPIHLRLDRSPAGDGSLWSDRVSRSMLFAIRPAGFQRCGRRWVSLSLNPLYASSAIKSRTSGRRSSVHTSSTALCARSQPMTGVALARNFASMAASLIGLAAVPLAWGT